MPVKSKKENKESKADSLIKKLRVLKIAIAGTKEPLEAHEGEISDTYIALKACLADFEDAVVEYVDEKEFER